MRQLSSWWYRTRESFWFIPILCLVAAFGLAQSMIALDKSITLDVSSPFYNTIYGVGIDGSRAMLGAIGTSMLAVAATAFSITISVVVTASSTYGPRLVGNFMSDRGNQTVLGVFVSTFLYALLVLRTIRSKDDDFTAFIPHLAINVGVLMAVADVVVLVWFIHHIASSVRVETLAHGVRKNFREVIERMHPEEARDHVVQTEPLGLEFAPVSAGGVGYIIDMDFDKFCSAAAHRDVVIEVIPRVGDHILPHETLVRVSPPDRAEDITDTVRNAVTIGNSRSDLQDIRYAEQQVLELAVRALSPGTNDPYTAVNAIEEVAAGVALAVSRPRPGNTMVDDTSTVRVRFKTVTVEEIVDLPFDQVRPYALDHVMVITALIDLAARIEGFSIHADVPARMREQTRVLLEEYRATNPPDHDVERVEDHLRMRRDELADSGDTR